MGGGGVRINIGSERRVMLLLRVFTGVQKAQINVVAVGSGRIEGPAVAGYPVAPVLAVVDGDAGVALHSGVGAERHDFPALLTTVFRRQHAGFLTENRPEVGRIGQRPADREPLLIVQRGGGVEPAVGVVFAGAFAVAGHNRAAWRDSDVGGGIFPHRQHGAAVVGEQQYGQVVAGNVDVVAAVLKRDDQRFSEIVGNHHRLDFERFLRRSAQRCAQRRR